ncbi:hypothetical protein V8E55_007197 [Tylopilus felleus]
MRWSANVMEHAHVENIKVPAHAGNNQDYYTQIARHLNRLEKCFHFDLEDHKPDAEKCAIAEYANAIHPVINYFSLSAALIQGYHPSAPKPFRTFATMTIALHLAIKPSLQLKLNEAALKYGLLGLASAVTTFFGQQSDMSPPDDLRLHIWHKGHVQQATYHNDKIMDPPQTLCIIPPTISNLYGQYDSVIISSQPESDWPKCGLEGHSVTQLRIVFHVVSSDVFLTYVQHFRIVPQGNPTNTSALTGMHMLKRAMRANGQHIREVVPLTLIHYPAHLIPHSGNEAHSCLSKLNSYKLSTEFWLNKYWLKEFYYALSPGYP